jgi:UDP-glucose 4-epimerase
MVDGSRPRSSEVKLISMQTLAGAEVLITGGAGMIGSHIARLAARQGARVTVLDALLPLYGGNPFNLKGLEETIGFLRGDIRDPDVMAAAVQGKDIIFNLAGQVSSVDSNQDPFLDLEINCRGNLTVLEVCRQHNRRAKLIFASSRLVYGTIAYNPVDENHPCNCRSIYGIHKLTGEKYYRFYWDVHGMDTVSLRLANPYGPRQQMIHSRYGIVNWFIRLALDGKPLTVFGDGQQKRDYIYSEDLAEAFLAVARTPGTGGQVYNVGSGCGTRFIEMARMVAAAVPGTEIVHLDCPAERQITETGDYISDLAKITAATSWRPRTELAAGIAQTVAFYRENREHYW